MTTEQLKIEIINFALQKISFQRQEIIQTFDVRPATVFQIINTLKAEQFLLEPERTGAKTGRKSPILLLNSDYSWIMGVDFQLDGVEIEVMDFCGKPQIRRKFQAGRRDEAEDCLNELKTAVQAIKLELGETFLKIKYAGFSDPGMVDSRNGVSLRAVNIKCWEKIPTAQWFLDNFGLTVKVWPETQIKAYMEYQKLKMPESTSLLFVETDDGIGGGLVKNGELFTGDTFRAMELGHIVVKPEGDLCQCGNRGCLEAMAGEAAIKKRVFQLMDDGVYTILKQSEFSLDKFIQAAPQDKLARMVCCEIGDYLGNALAAAVTLLNPSAIVIGGKLAKLNQLLLDPVKRTLTLNCFEGSIKQLKLELAQSESFANAHGAAVLMRQFGNIVDSVGKL